MSRFSRDLRFGRLSFRRRRSARGFIHIVLLVFAMMGLSIWGVSEIFLKSAEMQSERSAEERTNMDAARRALIDYALIPPPRRNIESGDGRYNALDMDSLSSPNVDLFVPGRTDQIWTVNGQSSEPYRYFGLPCPDTIMIDGNLDGTQDVFGSPTPTGGGFYRGCAWTNKGEQRRVVINLTDFPYRINATGTYPLQSYSRVGGFPWRTEFSEGDIRNRYYIRGAGDRRFVDSNDEPLWYTVSRNMMRVDRPLNPHLLLREESDWIVLATSTVAGSSGEVQRVAAAVVSPGEFGGLQNPLNIGFRENPGRTTDFPGGTFSHFLMFSGYNFLDHSYLPPRVGGPGRGVCEVGFDYVFASIESPRNPNCIPPAFANDPDQFILYGQEGSNDEFEYIVIEDLVKEGADILAGDGAGSRALIDLLEGKDDQFFGVRDMFHSHFMRYGYLPSPAAYSDGNAQKLERRPGAPAQEIDFDPSGTTYPVTPPGTPPGLFTRRVTEVQAAAVSEGITVTVLLPARNVRRVYLQPGAQLASEDVDVFLDGLPPYNIPLYQLDTEFNSRLMDEATREEMMTDNYYPRDNLLGFASDAEFERAFYTPFEVGGDIDFSFDLGNPFAARNSRVYMKEPPPARLINFINPQRVASGVVLSMALADPALAYVEGDSLAGRLTLGLNEANRATLDVSETPVYGMQVQLPVGTRFVLPSSRQTRSSLYLPSRFAENVSAFYNVTTRLWQLNAQASLPVRFEDRTDYFIRVTAVMSGLPAKSGDVGFLPVDDLDLHYLSPMSTVQLYFGPTLTGAQLTSFYGTPASDILLPDPDSFSAVSLRFRTPNGIILPTASRAYSRLPSDLLVYNPSTVDILPLGQPGLPLEGMADDLVPNVLRIDEREEFVLPTGTNIFYPDNANFGIGHDFEFPPGTRALLPPGIQMTARAARTNLPGTADFEFSLPGGRRIRTDENELHEVTFYHGAVMDLSGIRVVLREGTGIGSEQEVFDIEMNSFFQAGFGDVNTTALPAPPSAVSRFPPGTILQPLTGRLVNNGVRPINIAPNVTLNVASWTRMKFMTHPRRILLPDSLGVTLNLTTSVPNASIVRYDGSTTPPSPTGTVTLSLGEEFEFVGGIVAAEYNTGPLSVMVGPRLADVSSTVAIPMLLPIDEQTEFLLPPGDYEYADLFQADATSGDVTAFVMPAGSGVYSPKVQSFLPLELASRASGGGLPGAFSHPVLVNAITLPLVRVVEPFIGTQLGISPTQQSNASVYLAPRPYPVTNALAMFPDTDIVMRIGAGVAVLPADGVIDVNRGIAWPPGSSWTMKRVPEDMDAVSESPIYLYIPSDLTLYSRGPGALWFEEAYQQHPGFYLPPSGFETSGERLARIAADDAMTGNRVMAAFDFPTTDREFVVSRDSVFVIPPGSPLDFLSLSRHRSGVLSVDDVDYATLPEGTKLVLGAGSYFEGGAGTGTVVSVGAMSVIVLKNMGFVSHPDYMRESPIVYYPGETYLREADLPAAEGSADSLRIAAGSRGDIFGNITRRVASDFGVNLMPTDTAEVLRNFPMTYAVASGCRVEYGGGEDCAEDGQGLEFYAGDGEEVVLEEDTVFGDYAYVVLRSSLDAMIPMNVDRYNSLRELHAVPQNSSGSISGMRVFNLRQGENGIRASYTDNMTMKVDVVTDVDQAYVFRATAPGTFLRVYLNHPANLDYYMTTLTLGDTAMVDRFNERGAHYTDLRALTVVLDGYTKNRPGVRTDPLGRSVLTTINLEQAVTLRTGATEGTLALGVDAQYGYFRDGDMPFGKESVYTFADGTQMPMERFRMYRPGDAELLISIRGSAVRMDFAGNVGSRADYGDQLRAEGDWTALLNYQTVGGGDLDFLLDGGTFSELGVLPRAERLTLDIATTIPMEQGYLWQGYVGTQSGHVTVTLSVQAATALTVGGALTVDGYLRVHPKDEHLNFFASGDERVEAMDWRAPGRGNEFTVRGFELVGTTPPSTLSSNTTVMISVTMMAIPGSTPPSSVTITTFTTVAAVPPIQVTIQGGDTYLSPPDWFYDFDGGVEQDFLNVPIPGSGDWPDDMLSYQYIIDYLGAFSTTPALTADISILNAFQTRNRFEGLAGDASGRLFINHRLWPNGLHASVSVVLVDLDVIDPNTGAVERVQGTWTSRAYSSTENALVALWAGRRNWYSDLNTKLHDCPDDRLPGPVCATGVGNRVRGQVIQDQDGALAISTVVDSAGVLDNRMVLGTRNAAPFNVFDHAFLSNEREVWVHRLMVNENDEVLEGTDDDPSSVLGFALGASPVSLTVRYNPMAFPLNTEMAHYELGEYSKSARVLAVTTRVGCRGAGRGQGREYVRIPGMMMGPFGDVELHDPTASPDCAGDTVREPGFSARPRRNYVPGAYIGINRVNAPGSTLRVTPTNVLARGVSESLDVYEYVNNPIRAEVPVIGLTTTTGETAEVRGVSDNTPALFAPDIPFATVPARFQTTQNPRYYSMPQPYAVITNYAVVDRSTAIIGMEQDYGSVPRHARLVGDMFFYLDRAYNSSITVNGSEQGIPRQAIRLGDDFAITGPAALVQPFGGRRMDSTAEVYAARSRLINELFGRGDDFRLHTIYSQGGQICENEVAGAGAMTCPEMYDPDNVPYWAPIVSGVMAFEAVSIDIEGSDLSGLSVVMVVPQPRVTVMMTGSRQTVLLGGSIFDPHTGVAQRAFQIPLGFNSIMPIGSPAVAAVDVSPVHVPTPIRMRRQNLGVNSEIFSFAPVSVTTSAGMRIVQPVSFQRSTIASFDDVHVNRLTNSLAEGGHTDALGRPDPQPPQLVRDCHKAGRILNQRRARSSSIITDCRFQRWLSDINTNSGEELSPRRWVGQNFNRVVRYDGTHARGFLMNEQVAGIMSAYSHGKNIYTMTAAYRPYFPRRPYRDAYRNILTLRTAERDTATLTVNTTVSVDYNFPVSNQGAPLGNPFAWHWMSRSSITLGGFVPMGIGRQFPITRHYISVSTPPTLNPVFASTNEGLRRYFRNELSTSLLAPEQIGIFCGRDTRDARGYSYDAGAVDTDANSDQLPDGSDRRPEDPADTLFTGGPGLLPDGPDFLTFSEFENTPCIGENSAYWVGVRYFGSGVDTPPEVGQYEDDNDFLALRLPHKITIPEGVTISMLPLAQRDSPQFPYVPADPNDFFAFPRGSTAHILQVDASSWESMHPYASRYLGGALFANDGGLYSPSEPVTTLDIPAIAGSIRNKLHVAEEMRVMDENDGERIIDVSGRRVLHRTTSENAPGAYAMSNSPVYTNVWIRLPTGGALISMTVNAAGVTTRVALYLPPDTVVNPILNTYLPGDGIVETTPQEPLRGTYQSNAEIEDRIAVIPPAMVIPKGATIHVGRSGGNITEVRAAAIFSIRPLEDIKCASGNLGDDLQARGLGGTVTIDQAREGVSENNYPAASATFTLGHPCVWLDDRENTDGDRFYIYRSRRRHLQPYNVRVVSNDHTLLYGGRLTLNTPPHTAFTAVRS